MKSLHKGCEGFLAHIVALGEPSINVDDVPVVNEFTEVFPEDATDTRN